MDTVTIQVITWNVNTQFPGPATPLAALLPPDSAPDLVLLGLQEVKSQPQNLAADLLAGEDPWTAGLRASLASRGYVKVRSVRLVGIVLSLFSLGRHVPHIRGLETQYTRLGFGGYWGNKGCVSVRLSVYGVSLCVLNSHLAAHQHMNQDRLASYNQVLGSHTFSTPATQMILYHDYVLWMGDLNFRLAADPAELSAEAVIRRVEAGDTAALLQLDQLTIARNNGDAFSELDETKPKFAPSYKYKVGTQLYDTKRAPAWTDRVLHKANVANYDRYELKLEAGLYSALQQFTESDHKPVVATFTMAVFSPATARDLLLPCYNPIVRFVDAGPYYAGEDMLLIYTVNIEERRHLASWDWVGLFRADCSNLEDHVAYSWASTTLVRDGAYEVVLGGVEIMSPGSYRFVYFSAGSRDILGYSEPVRVELRQWEVELGVEAGEEL